MQSEDDQDQRQVLHRAEQISLQFTVRLLHRNPAVITSRLHKPQPCTTPHAVCIGYFFALKCTLIFCMPFSRPCVFMLDIREFLLWCISTIYLLAVSRLWLEEESYICCWHFSFYFNCADKLPTHKPSDYKTSHCCHVVVGVEETPQCQYNL